jgi:very-short-patch-repair endonuclease
MPTLTPQQKATNYSAALRRRMTKPELTLGRALVERNVWFKSQASFFAPDTGECFIADFRLAHPFGKILIEVDGASHRGREGYDAKRTEWLTRNRNCRVLRFTNERVLDDTDGVVAEILALGPVLGARDVERRRFTER